MVCKKWVEKQLCNQKSPSRHCWGRMEAGKEQTHKLPLPEWTPPAAAHTVANHFSAVLRALLTTAHSQHPVWKVEGRWLRGASPPALFHLSWTSAWRTCPTLSVLWAQCSVSCVLSCLVGVFSDGTQDWCLGFSVFQDPQRDSKVNQPPCWSVRHVSHYWFTVCFPPFTRVRPLLRYEHGVCNGHHRLRHLPDHLHHHICVLPCH